MKYALVKIVCEDVKKFQLPMSLSSKVNQLDDKHNLKN